MRLVDADKLAGEAVCLYTYGGARYIPLDALKRAPTVEQPRWIPVTERIPENGETAICYTKDGKVLYWMPLPAPPTPEEGSVVVEGD